MFEDLSFDLNDLDKNIICDPILKSLSSPNFIDDLKSERFSLDSHLFEITPPS